MLIQHLPSWQPRSYQREGVRLMLQHGAIGLLYAPGLGKTTITYAAYKLLKEAKLVDAMLVVCPKAAMTDVWPVQCKEWGDFESLGVGVLHGPERQQTLAQPHDIYVTNFESLQWILDNYHLSGRKMEMVVIDESSKIKDSSSKRFKAVKRLVTERGNPFKRRYILTGSAVAQGLEGLFSQIFVLDGGAALGKYVTHYRNKYFRAVEHTYAGYEVMPGCEAAILQRIAPLTHRLSAEDHLQMPQRMEKYHYYDLEPATQDLYDEMAEEMFIQLDVGDVLARNGAIAGGKCRQIASGFIYRPGTNGAAVAEPIHSQKLQTLKNLVDDLSGEPLLVAYQFIPEREAIVKEFDAPYIGSGTNPTRQRELIMLFNAGKLPMLLGHPASMGHGLNLQGACHHLAWYSLPWSLELYEQTLARIYRQGQKSEWVVQHFLLARNTLEHRVVLPVLKGRDMAQQRVLKLLDEYRKTFAHEHQKVYTDQLNVPLME